MVQGLIAMHLERYRDCGTELKARVVLESINDAHSAPNSALPPGRASGWKKASRNLLFQLAFSGFPVLGDALFLVASFLSSCRKPL
jgi:hypothetical protein